MGFCTPRRTVIESKKKQKLPCSSFRRLHSTAPKAPAKPTEGMKAAKKISSESKLAAKPWSPDPLPRLLVTRRSIARSRRVCK